jgi:hypothetical protein
MRAVKATDANMGDALAAVFEGVGGQFDAGTEVRQILFVQFHDYGL